jgi:hypothetical protein
MNPKTNTMLLILLAPFVLVAVARILSRPSRREYEQSLIRGAMASRFWEIQREIDRASLSELEDVVTDMIIDFYKEYKYVKGVRDDAGFLQSQKENRRSLLMMNRRKIRA